MGSRVQKIAGIILALAFVALLVIMNTNILNLGNTANNKLSSSLTVTDSYDLSAYDGATVTGDDVVNAIKTVNSLSAICKLKITVDTVAGSAVSYGYLNDSTNVITPYTVTDQRSDDYINPTAEFKAELVKNDNGITTEITFTQE